MTFGNSSFFQPVFLGIQSSKDGGGGGGGLSDLVGAVLGAAGSSTRPSAADADKSKKKRRKKNSELSRLHNVQTKSSKLKLRSSEEIDDIWAELESSSDDGGGGGDEEMDFAEADPTYELACLRRANQKTKALGAYVANSKRMFMLQVRVTRANTRSPRG